MTEYAWFDNGRGRQVYRPVPTARPAKSDLACPMIAGDTMEATQHPCDGRFYTSKARFRSETKAHGCVEMGNDPARLRMQDKPKPDRQAIRDTLQQARARLNA